MSYTLVGLGAFLFDFYSFQSLLLFSLISSFDHLLREGWDSTKLVKLHNMSGVPVPGIVVMGLSLYYKFCFM